MASPAHRVDPRPRSRPSAGAIALVAFGIALVLGIASAAGATTGVHGAGACAGRNGKIAVIRSEPGGDELGLLAGGRFIRLYKAPHDRAHPGYDRLADPSFSCDGREIVVAQTGGDPFEALIVVDLADRGARVVPTDHHRPVRPSFLADGRIVFAGPRIHHQPHTSFGVSRLGGTFEVDPDGSDLHRLFGRQELAASRDGRFFVDSSKPEGGRLELLGADGRVVRFLTPPPRRGRQWGEASFSPDGRWIVLVEGFGAAEHETISITRRDRPGLRRIPVGRSSASQPSFSPDGRRLVFIKSGSGTIGRPWLRALGPGGKERHLQLRTDFEFPIWGPR